MDLEKYIYKYQSAFQRIYRSVNDMIKQHVHDDITTDQFQILQFIKQHEQVTSTQIAQTMGVGKSAITALVNRLVQKEFIERERNEEDRRVVYLRLTDNGNKVVTATEKEIYQFIEDKLAHFPTEDIEGFLHALEKLSDLMANDEGEQK